MTEQQSWNTARQMFSGFDIPQTPPSVSLVRSFIFHLLAGVLLLTLFLPGQGNFSNRIDNRQITFNPVSMPMMVGDLRGHPSGSNFDKLPASKGVMPKMEEMPLAPPTVKPPEDAMLQVTPSIMGPLLSQAIGQVGCPTCAIGPASNGDKGGSTIGNNKGHLVGDEIGNDKWYRPGRGGVTAPRAIYSPDPLYTEEGRKTRTQGVVMIWVIINAEGRVEQARIQQSLGMGLDESALQAVKTWRFEPARKDKEPVPVQVSIEVNFRLF